MIGMWATPRHCGQEDDEHREQRQWNREGHVCLSPIQLRPKCYGTIKLPFLIWGLGALYDGRFSRVEAKHYGTGG